MKLALLIWGLWRLLPTADALTVDQGHDVFFPKDFSGYVTAAKSFPVFWWNFLVVEPAEPDEGSARACASLKALSGLRRVECGQSLAEFQPTVVDWARDLRLREDAPSTIEFAAAARGALAKASLPGMEPALFEILRADPMESWKALQRLAESRIPFRLPRVGGIFYDAETRRAILPLQFDYDPSQSARTREIEKAAAQLFPHARAVGIGPHFSTLANEDQVYRDVNLISLVGSITLVLTTVALLVLRRGRLARLIPPVLVATALSALATACWFGSIHGLTLAFGTAIIGLALDYGFHGALHPDAEGVWRANHYGLLTTVAGLIVLACSSLPILRQLMVFSTLGLVTAYFLLWWLEARWPRVFETRPFALVTPAPHRIAVIATLGLAAIGLISAALFRPGLDLRQLDFHREGAGSELAQWVFQKTELRSPLFELHTAADALASAEREQAWAIAQGVRLENLASYLPTASIQAAHQASWSAARCAELRRAVPAGAAEFFAPFFERAACAPGAAFSPLDTEQVPHYLRHLRSATGSREWVTLWLPISPSEETYVQTAFPRATSLAAIAKVFPERLGQELRWMVPLSLALALALLVRFFHGWRLAGVAMLPFLCGVGLFALAAWAFHLPTSFMTVVGLIMVFGFSIDYGIFVTHLIDQGTPAAGDTQAWHAVHAVWSSIALSAVSTLIGFLPLLFARHPVLLQLGQSLFLGSLGAVLGVRVAIPGVLRVQGVRS